MSVPSAAAFTPFGLPLEAATPEGAAMPLIVVHSLLFLSAHASPAPQDLFVPEKADQSIVAKLRKVFDRVLDPRAPSLIQKLTVPPHTVAQLLVWYLRELPEPLIPEKYVYTFLKIWSIEDRGTRAQQMRVLFYALPEVNRRVIIAVCEYLSECGLPLSSYVPYFLEGFFKTSLLSNPALQRSLTFIFAEFVIQVSYMSKVVNEPRVPVNAVPISKEPEYVISAIAVFDFAGGPYLIPLKKGDIVSILDIKLEPGWLKAKKGTEVGYIPEAFVKIVAEEPPKVPAVGPPLPAAAVPTVKHARRLSAPPTSSEEPGPRSPTRAGGKIRIVHAKSRVLSSSERPSAVAGSDSPPAAAKDPHVITDWKSKLTPEELAELPHMLNGREIRAKEIMTSEKTYVEFLSIMTDLFVRPLQKNPMGLTKEEILAVFSNVEVLEVCHKKLYQIIESRLASWNENSVIGDVFLTNTEFIKFYRYYVNNYEASLDALEKCKKKSEEFAKYLASLETTPKMRGMKLVSFLVAPVQRVMRYSMLLEEVLKKTPKGHPDVEPLRHAVAMTKNMAQYVNEKKRNVENLAAFQEFLGKLKGFSAEVTQDARRVLLKEGDAALNTASTHVHLFLYTDLLFITKPGKRDKFSFRQMFVLSKSNIVADNSQAFKSFKINAPQVESSELIFESPSEAAEWFKAIFSASQAQNDFEKLLVRSTSSMRIALSGDSVFSQRANMERAKKQRLRLESIIDGETKFGERMNNIWTIFMEPLTMQGDERAAMMKKEKVNMLVTNFNLVRTLQPAFVDAMKARLAEWTRTNTFSDVLKANMNYIRSYVLYVTHYTDIHNTLIEGCKNSAFNIWLVRHEAENKTSLEKEIAEPLNHFSDLFFALQEFSLMSRKDNPDGEELKAMMAKVKAIKDDFVLHATKIKSIPEVAKAVNKFTSEGSKS